MGKILEKLEDASVLRIRVGPGKQCAVLDGFEGYQYATLNKGELLAWAKEIKEVAEGL